MTTAAMKAMKRKRTQTGETDRENTRKINARINTMDYRKRSVHNQNTRLGALMLGCLVLCVGVWVKIDQPHSTHMVFLLRHRQIRFIHCVVFGHENSTNLRLCGNSFGHTMMGWHPTKTKRKFVTYHYYDYDGDYYYDFIERVFIYKTYAHDT